MKSIFDSCVWISARNEVYGLPVFSGVWTRLGSAVERGDIVSPPEVIEEIARKSDELNQWISARKRALTTPLLASGKAQEVEHSVQELREKHPSLSRREADYYVIAWGKALGWPVVTLENDASTRKIPGVCRAENVVCISPLEFMRQQGWKFPAP